jgi:perosamine synthetase
MIPVNEPLLDGNEKKYLIECIETGWISSEGPFVKKLEEGMAKIAGRKHGVAVCNGSIALDIAVEALGIGAGDEVILPSFTIISCATAITRAGAMPVVVDSDPISWNMDVGRIAEKITPRTKAIMVVHIYGLPVDMDPVMELARKHGLKVIEDSAEVIGQTYRSQSGAVEDSRWERGDRKPESGTQIKPCGSFGDISTFSFYPNKHVTTGEGGMVFTDDDSLAERCRSLRNLCFGPKRFVHENIGWNGRMSNLQAAVGVAQMERLDQFVVRKREIGHLYNELLAGVDWLELPLPHTDYAENIYWVYGVVLKDSVPFDAEEAMKRLGKLGIGTRPFFWPMHEQPVFRRMGLFSGEECPVASRLARRGFYVPSGLGLSENQQESVAEKMKHLISN